MKLWKISFIALSLFLTVVADLSAASLMKATIPQNAPFRFGDISWNFGTVAQGVSLSSFFDLENTSFVTISFTITPLKDYTFTPSSGLLVPRRPVRITVRLNQTAPSGSSPGGQFTINASKGDPIINWTVTANIVDAKPDLSATFTVGNPVAQQNGARVPVSIKVSNRINLVPSKPCEIKVFLDNTAVKTVTLQTVNAGANTTIDGTFETNRPGVHEVRVFVDSNKVNDELDELNNEPNPQSVTLP